MRNWYIVGLLLVMLITGAVCVAAEKTKDGFSIVSSEQLGGIRDTGDSGDIIPILA